MQVMDMSYERVYKTNYLFISILSWIFLSDACIHDDCENIKSDVKPQNIYPE